MGFKLPGKSVHSGTSSHRSALTMKSDHDTAAKKRVQQHVMPDGSTMDGAEHAEPGSSPNKILPVLAIGGRVLATQLLKKGVQHGTKKIIQQGSKNLVKNLATSSTSKFIPNALGRTLNSAKGMYNKLPGWGKSIIKQGAIYAGIDQGINLLSGDDDKEQKTTNTTVTPPKTTTTKKKKSNGSYSRAKKNDPNLASYIAGRKKHAKGSDEYNAFQNKINKAYGSKTRHGVTSSSSTKGRKTSSMTSTPGLGTGTRVQTKQKDGDVKLTKSTFSDDRGVTTKKTRTKRGVFSDKVRSQKTVKVTKGAAGSDLADKKTKVKTKYTKSGDVKRNKKVVTQDGMRTVTKTNRRGKTTTKTKKTLNPFD
mgnify:CR=1 FL=1